MLRFYRTPIPGAPRGAASEWCFYVQLSADLTVSEYQRLRWLLGETYEPDKLQRNSFLLGCLTVIEIGPRFNFETAWSTTAVSICHACGLTKIMRLERSRRYGFLQMLSTKEVDNFLAAHHDRMTEMRYEVQPTNFMVDKVVAPVEIIPLIQKGKDALIAVNKRLGLGMDDQDIEFYYNLYLKDLKRNPNDVESGQLGNGNCEHSRHGYFKARLIIDGEEMPYSLMDIIKEPWRRNPGRTTVGFGDDSSAFAGYQVRIIIPNQPGHPSPFIAVERNLDPILTAESHNHPSGFEPYQGAGTGKGGELRDRHAMRRGGLPTGGGAGYLVGNLHIPGYNLPWENDGWRQPANLASPLDILIRASDGAYDYGNCYGDPLFYGIARSFGAEINYEYRSWFKPVMYSVGVGLMDHAHLELEEPKQGMLIVQIGGPAYRIGIGGGAASSLEAGENAAELDFSSVQRGAPQMEQLIFRLIRTCVEMGDKNPIIKIGDLGAGGDGNQLPELSLPAGARIYLRKIPVGDQTLSTVEIWCNEAQERIAFLVWPNRFDEIKAICDREGTPCAIVGHITGDGYLVLFDENDGSTPVELPLDKILGQLPQKIFRDKRKQQLLKPLKFPADLTVREALERVLRLISVGSKRFLTTKVDRSVTGLVAQQQCVGPNHITLSDYAVVAHSHLGLTGTALSLGEQPIKGLLSPKNMSRLAVTEALLNLIGAKITTIEDIKCSANWMVPAKKPGEGAWLYDAAIALRDIVLQLLAPIPDGGKDSLSMVANDAIGSDGEKHTVKAPGELILSAYAPMDDITRKVTSDFKKAGNELLFIDLSGDQHRLGGSALAQVFMQVGTDCPDVNVDILSPTFKAVQELVDRGLIASVHDRSDGGLIVTFLEMAFAGNLGVNIVMQTNDDLLPFFFNEEPGLVIECIDSQAVQEVLTRYRVPHEHAGWVTDDHLVTAYLNGDLVLDESMVTLRAIWEETSSQLDRLQANPECVIKEAKAIHSLITPPQYHLTFLPAPTPGTIMDATFKPKVAILRERGSNGDREMAAAFLSAGFEPWDVTMTDLLDGHITLDAFQGIAFVGGFAFADVLDAGKGWAGVIHFNERLAEMFERFRNRPDTFSLGICNGCQLMALLGWVPGGVTDPAIQPRFIRNKSGRFESRFSTVQIQESPSIMLKGMAGSNLGVWVAHGEGQFYSNTQVLNNIIRHRLAPLRFIDPVGQITKEYPFNPNGSPKGITALCSFDGRHLAMMPHPERTFLTWQWPWLPDDWKKLLASPWLKLFQNAYYWCMQNK